MLCLTRWRHVFASGDLGFQGCWASRARAKRVPTGHRPRPSLCRPLSRETVTWAPPCVQAHASLSCEGRGCVPGFASPARAALCSDRAARNLFGKADVSPANRSPPRRPGKAAPGDATPTNGEKPRHCVGQPAPSPARAVWQWQAAEGSWNFGSVWAPGGQEARAASFRGPVSFGVVLLAYNSRKKNLQCMEY